MKSFIWIIPVLFLLSACSTAVQEEGSDVLAGKNSFYVKFSEEAYEKAIENNKIIVLYFYANWCPTCKDENSQLVDAINELERDDVVAFRVNYKDSKTDGLEKELAKEYGITLQHTKVVLKEGNRVIKALDTWDKSRYLEELSEL